MFRQIHVFIIIFKMLHVYAYTCIVDESLVHYTVKEAASSNPVNVLFHDYIYIFIHLLIQLFEYKSSF